MSSVTQRNLTVLRNRDPQAAATLAQASTPENVNLRETRTGRPSLVVLQNGRPRWLHSRVDPDRESQRLCDTIPTQSGFIVVFGLGLGYHLRRLLARETVRRVVVCEPNPSIAAAALEQAELEPVFADPRVVWHLQDDDGKLTDRVGTLYVPLLQREAALLPLRGRTDLDPAVFTRLQDAAKVGIDQALADFATQRAFGRRWMHNILINMMKVRERTETRSIPGRRIVTAAGPSLEAALEGVRFRRDVRIVAADTSLPVLLQRGITPSFVVSIDGQVASYHHFTAGMPTETILVADIAASPSVVRRARRVDLRMGRHPLARYAARHWTALPDLYSAGGSVAHAALAFAEEAPIAEKAPTPDGRRRDSQERELFIFGADFSYPNAAPYARESYIHRHARAFASRLAPTEHRLAAFVYRRAHGIPGTHRYESALLTRYRHQLEHLAREFGLTLRMDDAAGMDASAGRDASAQMQASADTEASTDMGSRVEASEDEDSSQRGARRLHALQTGPHHGSAVHDGSDRHQGSAGRGTAQAQPLSHKTHSHRLPDPRPFLHGYRQALSSLDDIDDTATVGLTPEEGNATIRRDAAELWWTLTPLAASLAEMDNGAAIPTEAPGRALSRAREVALRLLDRLPTHS